MPRWGVGAFKAVRPSSAHPGRPALHGCVEFRAIFPYGQSVHWRFSRFKVNFNLKPLFEKILQHEPNLIVRGFRRHGGSQGIVLRVQPLRPEYTPEWHGVRISEKALQCRVRTGISSMLARPACPRRVKLRARSAGSYPLDRRGIEPWRGRRAPLGLRKGRRREQQGYGGQYTYRNSTHWPTRFPVEEQAATNGSRLSSVNLGREGPASARTSAQS